MQTLNMCDFCSYEKADCGAQPALAELLNLDNLEEHRTSVVACDKYKSPVDVLKERFHDPNL